LKIERAINLITGSKHNIPQERQLLHN